MVVGGSTLPQGLVLTFDVDPGPDPDPELDKKCCLNLTLKTQLTSRERVKH